MFGNRYHLSPLNYIITCIIDFLLDPLNPQFYYISTGLRGSISHGDFSLMVYVDFMVGGMCREAVIGKLIERGRGQNFVANANT